MDERERNPNHLMHPQKGEFIRLLHRNTLKGVGFRYGWI